MKTNQIDDHYSLKVLEEAENTHNNYFSLMVKDYIESKKSIIYIICSKVSSDKPNLYIPNM